MLRTTSLKKVEGRAGMAGKGKNLPNPSLRYLLCYFVGQLACQMVLQDSSKGTLLEECQRLHYKTLPAIFMKN
jgi:hypothetical protein